MDQANRILSSGPTVSNSFGGSMMTIDEARESPRPYLKNNKALRATTLSQKSFTNDEGKQRKKKSVERGRSFLEKKSSIEDQSDRQVRVGVVLIVVIVSGCGLDSGIASLLVGVVLIVVLLRC